MNFIIKMTITTTVTAAGILMIKTIFKNKMSPKLHYYIWTILAIRILIPILPKSNLSVFNLVPMVQIEDIDIYPATQSESDITIDISNKNISSENSYKDTDKTFLIIEKVQQKAITLWLWGAVIVFFFFICIYLLFCYRLRKMSICHDKEVIKILDEYKRVMGIKRNVSIITYGDIPMLKGIFRPIIIIPENYDTEDLKYIVVHELCHLKHNDILINLISIILLCINWHNPVIWVCHFIFRRDAELLCDERVLTIIGNKKEYATLLLKVSSNKSNLLPITTCMDNGKHGIVRRIQFMANYKKPKTIWTIIIVISIGLLCAGCLLNETSGGRDNIFAHENLNPLLGKEKDLVFKTLDIDAKNYGDIKLEEEYKEIFTLKESIEVNGKSATLTITFYNGIMLDYSYTFSSVEDGFEYAKHIRDLMGKSYGEPINYPDRILQNKFDDINSLEDIKINENPDFMFWFEEWEVNRSKELIDLLFDGIKPHKIYKQPKELKKRLHFEITPNDASIVTVGYKSSYSNGLRDDE